jgi:hypothetical protein
MLAPDLLIILWIIFVVVIWIFIRRKKPGLLGLGRKPNKQRLDSVKFASCPNCNHGFLEPKFKWWQHSLLISTPIGFLLIGKPYEYECTSCNFKKDGSHEKGIFTRLSLAHKLSKPFFIGIGINIVVGLILAAILLRFIKN